MEEPNPYAPRLVESLAKPDPSSQLPADIRMLHRAHEASLRQIGLYYILTSVLGGIFTLPMTLYLFATLLSNQTINLDILIAAFIFLAILGLLILGILVGAGLRNLHRRTLIPATISAIIWMFHFPVGTAVNIYLLYLLYSKKGRRILQDDYQNIIAATPEMKLNRDWEVWCVFGLCLFLLIVFAAVVALVPAS